MALDFVLEPGIVRVSGNLTLGPRLLEFGRRVAEQMSSGTGPGIIVDLTQVQDIDSAGLGEIVILYTTAGQHGRRLCLVKPSPRIVKLLEMTRLSGMLPHFADESAAVEWLNGRG